MSENKFNLGDTVRLKSVGKAYANDGPVMTVFFIKDNLISCRWFNTVSSGNYEMSENKFFDYELIKY